MSVPNIESIRAISERTYQNLLEKEIDDICAYWATIITDRARGLGDKYVIFTPQVEECKVSSDIRGEALKKVAELYREAGYAVNMTFSSYDDKMSIPCTIKVSWGEE